MQKTIAISFKGDKEEVLAINQIARELEITSGELVADAVREKYKARLEPLVSFFRERALQNRQLPELNGESHA